MNIDHINIAASEPLLGELREFYCRVFGLEEGFRPDFILRPIPLTLALITLAFLAYNVWGIVQHRREAEDR